MTFFSGTCLRLSIWGGNDNYAQMNPSLRKLGFGDEKLGFRYRSSYGRTRVLSRWHCIKSFVFSGSTDVCAIIKYFLRSWQVVLGVPQPSEPRTPLTEDRVAILLFADTVGLPPQVGAYSKF